MPPAKLQHRNAHVFALQDTRPHPLRHTATTKRTDSRRHHTCMIQHAPSVGRCDAARITSRHANDLQQRCHICKAPNIQRGPRTTADYNVAPLRNAHHFAQVSEEKPPRRSVCRKNVETIREEREAVTGGAASASRTTNRAVVLQFKQDAVRDSNINLHWSAPPRVGHVIHTRSQGTRTHTRRTCAFFNRNGSLEPDAMRTISTQPLLHAASSTCSEDGTTATTSNARMKSCVGRRTFTCVK